MARLNYCNGPKLIHTIQLNPSRARDLTPGVLVGYVLLIFLVCLCCHSMWLYILSSVLWCPLRFPHKNDARYVLTSSCLSYLPYLCFLVHNVVQHVLTIWDMRNMTGVLWEGVWGGGRNCLPLSGACIHSRFLVGSLLLIFLVFWVVFFFVGLRLVSWVPNVASFSGLSILDYPCCFLRRLCAIFII